MDDTTLDWKQKQKLMRQVFPTIEGVWEGTYRHLDDKGALIDEHKSRLILRFSQDGPTPLLHTNIYTWEDGRKVRRHFPVNFDNGRLLYDNELIKGYFERVSEDDHNQTVLGYWRNKARDGIYCYEMIQRSGDGTYRTRVWQWIKDDGAFFVAQSSTSVGSAKIGGTMPTISKGYNALN